ncbi:MAG: hypothetical protein PUA68_07980 [Bacilli bacterium]|nr:hypothetical protein [Bacilli bacterium]
MNEERRKRATNFIGFINGVVDKYIEHPAMGLIHGFQKDAIQNGWGHRINNTDWKMIFKYIENEKGHFFIVEDCGNTGLIGNNYSSDEIEELQIQGKLGPNEKLARFSSLYNSGGNTTSAGLYGQGKIMYQAVSQKYLEYFDSYTQEGKYYANFVDLDDTNNKAFEEKDAINYIKEKTGLDKKDTFGTRVIISDPIPELIDSLRNGQLLNDINETWWRIIAKYNATIELYDGEKLIGIATIPDTYKKYYEDTKHSFIWKNISLEPEYRIKSIGFIYTDEENELLVKNESTGEEYDYLGNIAYYRNDMKIGNVLEIDSLGLDSKLKNRISGFLELDKEWEDKLKDNENQTHYGVKSKNKKDYQKMKTAVISYLEEFLIMKGLKKKNNHVDPNRDLKELANDLTDFLKDCNLDLDLSTLKNNGKIKPIEISCVKEYPNYGLRTIEYGQELNLKYKILKNVNDIDYTVDIIFTDELGNDKIYSSENVSINSNEYESGLISISYDDFIPNNRNLVKLLVRSNSNVNTKASCSFPIFVGKDEKEGNEDLIFKLNKIVLPNQETRRINYNEKIEKIELKIINNLNKEYVVGISGFIQDVNDRNNTIETIYRNNDIKLECNSEKSITINDVVFGEKFLNRKGPMKIKFKLSHISGLDYEKGEELKEIFITILYEEDQSDNTANLFDIHTNDLNDPKVKSKLEHNGDIYDLIFNTDYVMYKFIPTDKTDPFYKEYYIGEMLKTLITIKFQNGDYSFIGCDDETIKALSADEITSRTKNFVDSYMSQYFEMRG